MPPKAWALTVTLLAAKDADGLPQPDSLVVALAARVVIEKPAGSLLEIVKEPPKSSAVLKVPALTSPSEAMLTLAGTEKVTFWVAEVAAPTVARPSAAIMAKRGK